MLNKKVLRYVDRLLRDVCSNDQPFGGKTVLLGGDWKQLPPVVEHGTREDQINESIKSDPLFRENFETLRYVFSKDKCSLYILFFIICVSNMFGSGNL